MLQVNTKAPNFTLNNENGDPISLSNYLGQKVVVYFYPKDNTPVCTKQACAFRDAYDGLSDPNLEAIQAYDVWKEKKLYGKVSMGVMRTTYIINEEGYIEHVFEKAKPDTNAYEILDYLKKANG